MMCKLNGQMDKEGHYDVEMKGWMQKRTGIMVWKSKDGWKRWHYNVQIKRGDEYGRVL